MKYLTQFIFIVYLTEQLIYNWYEKTKRRELYQVCKPEYHQYLQGRIDKKSSKWFGKQNGTQTPEEYNGNWRNLSKNLKERCAALIKSKILFSCQLEGKIKRV